MDPTAIFNALLGSGPVALILFYWVYQERKERRELQARLLSALDKQAEIGDAVRMALLIGKKEARE